MNLDHVHGEKRNIRHECQELIRHDPWRASSMIKDHVHVYVKHLVWSSIFKSARIHEKISD